MDDSGRRSRLRGRRVPERWKAPLLDFALWAVLAALTLTELAGTPSHAMAVEGAVALAVLAVGLQRRFPHAALTAVTAYAAAQALLTGLGATSTTILVVPYLCVCVSSFRAGLFSGRARPVVTLTAVTAAAAFAGYAASGTVLGYTSRAFLAGADDWASVALALVLTLVTPWLFGRYWHWQSLVGRGGWEMAERMERARVAETDRARLLERARIASRMHDSLGHDLALIAVRAAALEMSAKDDPERREAAAELRGAAHDANLRLREVIGVLREEPEDTPTETVSDLVERASDAGLSVRLLREGSDPDPGSASGRAAHRVVQEALTNAAKYAPGAEVSVRIVRGGGVTRVTVEDTGAVTESALPARSEDTEGGLAGLRALAADEGGTFESGPSGDGFAVRAVLPDTHGSPRPPP
uniref:sensor histidine kinase n=1 Tax=Nocardiopsis ganjiahuensis TaxID=239984 RepID=UPI00036421BB